MPETEPKVTKGHCPLCGPSRAADILGEYKDEYSDDEVGIWGSTHYRILRCRGCEESIYFQTDAVFSEDYDQGYDFNGQEYMRLNHKIEHFPPATRRSQPDWSVRISVADKDLGSLFEDIYGALNADLRVPAAISMRTALDRASELLGVDAGLSFNQKLAELRGAGKIGGDEEQTLSVLVDAGSAAAHRGWRPSAESLDAMISILEGFLNRTFVLGAAAKELGKVVPPKPARPKSKKK